MEMILGTALILGGPVLYLWMQIRALALWRGVWLGVAALPLVVMGGAVIVTIGALRDGSNIAPILLVFAAPVCILWLFLASLFRPGRAR